MADVDRVQLPPEQRNIENNQDTSTTSQGPTSQEAAEPVNSKIFIIER